MRTIMSEHMRNYKSTGLFKNRMLNKGEKTCNNESGGKFRFDELKISTCPATARMKINNSLTSIIPRANVGIKNKLQNFDLVIHCKDRVRDDGYHALAPDQTYTFGFTLDIILNRTLWFCNFTWQQESHDFDIFIQMRDKCTSCNWLIFLRGPCRLIRETETKICYIWEGKKQYELQGRKKLLISNTTTQQEPHLALQSLNSHERGI
ncbi:unnamed protein product [Lupinus luteus]|uniref:S-protein homolog n=1 Tax=Lupinus luteus TaxID=3873 RepID=A0AAV1Y453_LUPLU